MTSKAQSCAVGASHAPKGGSTVGSVASRPTVVKEAKTVQLLSLGVPSGLGMRVARMEVMAANNPDEVRATSEALCVAPAGGKEPSRIAHFRSAVFTIHSEKRRKYCRNPSRCSAGNA